MGHIDSILFDKGYFILSREDTVGHYASVLPFSSEEAEAVIGITVEGRGRRKLLHKLHFPHILAKVRLDWKTIPIP